MGILMCRKIVVDSLDHGKKVKAREEEETRREEKEIVDWIATQGNFQIGALTDVWRQGGFICSTVLRCSGFLYPCPHAVHAGIGHAQQLAEVTLKLPRMFTEEELMYKELPNQLEIKFIRFLKEIRAALKAEEKDERMHSLRVAEELAGRGIGLYGAYSGRTAMWFLYHTVQGECLDGVLVEVRGPGGLFGSLVTGVGANKENTITMDYKMEGGRIKGYYIPPLKGPYEVTLSRHGCHVPGSPFNLRVDDPPFNYDGDLGASAWFKSKLSLSKKNELTQTINAIGEQFFFNRLRPLDSLGPDLIDFSDNKLFSNADRYSAFNTCLRKRNSQIIKTFNRNEPSLIKTLNKSTTNENEIATKIFSSRQSQISRSEIISSTGRLETISDRSTEESGTDSIDSESRNQKSVDEGSAELQESTENYGNQTRVSTFNSTNGSKDLQGRGINIATGLIPYGIRISPVYNLTNQVSGNLTFSKLYGPGKVTVQSCTVVSYSNSTAEKLNHNTKSSPKTNVSEKEGTYCEYTVINPGQLANSTRYPQPLIKKDQNQNNPPTYLQESDSRGSRSVIRNQVVLQKYQGPDSDNCSQNLDGLLLKPDKKENSSRHGETNVKSQETGTQEDRINISKKQIQQVSMKGTSQGYKEVNSPKSSAEKLKLEKLEKQRLPEERNDLIQGSSNFKTDAEKNQVKSPIRVQPVNSNDTVQSSAYVKYLNSTDTDCSAKQDSVFSQKGTVPSSEVLNHSTDSDKSNPQENIIPNRQGSSNDILQRSTVISYHSDSGAVKLWQNNMTSPKRHKSADNTFHSSANISDNIEPNAVKSQHDNPISPTRYVSPIDTIQCCTLSHQARDYDAEKLGQDSSVNTNRLSTSIQTFMSSPVASQPYNPEAVNLNPTVISQTNDSDSDELLKHYKENPNRPKSTKDALQTFLFAPESSDPDTIKLQQDCTVSPSRLVSSKDFHQSLTTISRANDSDAVILQKNLPQNSTVSLNRQVTATSPSSTAIPQSYVSDLVKQHQDSSVIPNRSLSARDTHHSSRAISPSYTYDGDKQQQYYLGSPNLVATRDIHQSPKDISPSYLSRAVKQDDSGSPNRHRSASDVHQSSTAVPQTTNSACEKRQHGNLETPNRHSILEAPHQSLTATNPDNAVNQPQEKSGSQISHVSAKDTHQSSTAIPQAHDSGLSNQQEDKTGSPNRHVSAKDTHQSSTAVLQAYDSSLIKQQEDKTGSPNRHVSAQDTHQSSTATLQAYDSGLVKQQGDRTGSPNQFLSATNTHETPTTFPQAYDSVLIKQQEDKTGSPNQFLSATNKHETPTPFPQAYDSVLIKQQEDSIRSPNRQVPAKDTRHRSSTTLKTNGSEAVKQQQGNANSPNQHLPTKDPHPSSTAVLQAHDSETVKQQKNKKESTIRNLPVKETHQSSRAASESYDSETAKLRQDNKESRHQYVLDKETHKNSAVNLQCHNKSDAAKPPLRNPVHQGRKGVSDKEACQTSTVIPHSNNSEAVKMKQSNPTSRDRHSSSQETLQSTSVISHCDDASVSKLKENKSASPNQHAPQTPKASPYPQHSQTADYKTVQDKDSQNQSKNVAANYTTSESPVHSSSKNSQTKKTRRDKSASPNRNTLSKNSAQNSTASTSHDSKAKELRHQNSINRPIIGKYRSQNFTAIQKFFNEINSNPSTSTEKVSVSRKSRAPTTPDQPNKDPNFKKVSFSSNKCFMAPAQPCWATPSLSDSSTSDNVSPKETPPVSTKSWDLSFLNNNILPDCSSPNPEKNLWTTWAEMTPSESDLISYQNSSKSKVEEPFPDKTLNSSTVKLEKNNNTDQLQETKNKMKSEVTKANSSSPKYVLLAKDAAKFAPGSPEPGSPGSNNISNLREIFLATKKEEVSTREINTSKKESKTSGNTATTNDLVQGTKTTSNKTVQSEVQSNSNKPVVVKISQYASNEKEILKEQVNKMKQLWDDVAEATSESSPPKPEESADEAAPPLPGIVSKSKDLFEKMTLQNPESSEEQPSQAAKDNADQKIPRPTVKKIVRTDSINKRQRKANFMKARNKFLSLEKNDKQNSKVPNLPTGLPIHKQRSISKLKRLTALSKTLRVWRDKASTNHPNYKVSEYTLQNEIKVKMSIDEAYSLIRPHRMKGNKLVTETFFPNVLNSVPNSWAVAASLNSLDNLSKKNAYDEIETVNIVKPKKPKSGFQIGGFSAEYPYLPTTPAFKSKPRSQMGHKAHKRGQLFF